MQSSRGLREITRLLCSLVEKSRREHVSYESLSGEVRKRTRILYNSSADGSRREHISYAIFQRSRGEHVSHEILQRRGQGGNSNPMQSWCGDVKEWIRIQCNPAVEVIRISWHWGKTTKGGEVSRIGIYDSSIRCWLGEDKFIRA